MKIHWLVVLATLVPAFGFAAANHDEDDGGPSPTLLSADRAKVRAYPGGHDEQDLTVQATLPMPTRVLDATTKDPLQNLDNESPDQPEEGSSHD